MMSTPLITEFPHILQDLLQQRAEQSTAALRTIYIAYSGGLDSHVLLHLLRNLQADFPELTLCALHVNHGLQASAQAWAQHCQQVCADLTIHCELLTVAAQAEPGQSPEAGARHARYTAFAQYIDTHSVLLTAHQQDDQAETLLLQLLRGAGDRGLACMPLLMPFAQGYLLRPLLNFPRQQLADYAHAQQLKWIEDDSNLDQRFDRNYLRHEVMPRLKQRWPATSRVLARSARHYAQHSHLLNDIAAQDYQDLMCKKEQALMLAGLAQLSTCRQANVIRYWLRCLELPLPSEKQLQLIFTDVIAARDDANPTLSWPGVQVHRYAGCLYACMPLPPIASDWQARWDLCSDLMLPGGLGTLSPEHLQIEQLRAALKPSATTAVTVRFRRGGERCHPQGRQGSHPLKKLMQEWGIPPWLRNRVPLIYWNEQLVAVVGYCICV